MTWIFAFLALVFFCTSLFLLYKVYNLASIIMVCEDDYSDCIDSLLQVEQKLTAVIEMPIFFENEEIRGIVNKAIEEVMLSRGVVVRAAEKFVEKSENKYITYEAENEQPPQQLQPPEGYEIVDQTVFGRTS